MIQRKQTIWLLLATLLAFVSIKLTFFIGIDTANQQVSLTPINSSNLFLLILIIGVGLLALITIFLFGNRKLQLRLTIVDLLVSVGNIALFVLEAQKMVRGEWAIYAILPLLIPFLLIMAARGIYKDEKTVKSLDRLR